MAIRATSDHPWTASCCMNGGARCGRTALAGQAGSAAVYSRRWLPGRGAHGTVRQVGALPGLGSTARYGLGGKGEGFFVALERRHECGVAKRDRHESSTLKYGAWAQSRLWTARFTRLAPVPSCNSPPPGGPRSTDRFLVMYGSGAVCRPKVQPVSWHAIMERYTYIQLQL